MAPSSSSRVLPRLRLGVLIAAVALVALAPWWHNRAYLRDFYDYGLVMAGNGRILQGERPYVDFTTPIQSATFLANLAAERAGGGTYLGMTGGLAVAVVLAAIVFTATLARRWPGWLAAVVAAAVIVASLSQHTILWHNTMGVAALAAVAWGGALAPVLGRRTWPWHLLVGAGLLWGGLNKLNFHLLAMAVAIGWAFREVLARRANGRQWAATVAFVWCAGIVLPVAVEIAWTRAAPADWWRNVVAVPLTSRGGDLGRLAHWKMLWEPVHDYYGPLWLRPIGAFIVVLVLAATAGLWRRANGERLVLAATALLALAGALGLYATNYEIGYVAAAAALVLAGAIVLGFGGGRPGAVLTAVLALAALGLGVCGWESAWRGQRSQFGHAAAPRREYVDAGTCGPAFRYFAGLRIPPVWAEPASRVAATLPPPERTGLLPVFYGQGMEWLERAFPAVKRNGLPLWMHFGTSYGRDETGRLAGVLGTRPGVAAYYAAVPWIALPPELAEVFARDYEKLPVAGYMVRWIHVEVPDEAETAAGGPSRTLAEALGKPDGIDALNTVGGNLNPMEVRLAGAGARRVEASGAGAGFLGTAGGRACISLPTDVHHFRVELVVRRTGEGTAAATAGFALRHHETRSNLACYRLQLEPGETERAWPVELMNLGTPVDLLVEVPAEAAGRLVAGYRGLAITHTEVPTGPPPALRSAAARWTRTDGGWWRDAVGRGSWTPAEVYATGVELRDDRVLIAPGGEFWVRSVEPFVQFAAEAERVPAASGVPVLRFVWSKGARLDMLSQRALRDGSNPFAFRGWSPEGGGWFGFLVDPGEVASVALRFAPANP